MKIIKVITILLLLNTRGVQANAFQLIEGICNIIGGVADLMEGPKGTKPKKNLTLKQNKEAVKKEANSNSTKSD